MTEEKKPDITESAIKPEPESNQNDSREFLNLEHHQTIYSRLLLAQNSDAEKIPDLLDPTRPIGEKDVQEINLNNRDYDPIISPLSLSERHDAWDQVIRDHGFDEAYSKWSGSILGSLIQTTDEKRLAVISHFLGKDSRFEQTDINNLYESFCKSGSKITEFVNKALQNSDLEFSEVEWLARKLFGKNSGAVTHRLLELEASLHSNQEQTVQNLFYKDGNIDLDRINNSTEEEKEILSLLSQNFEKPKTGARVHSPQQKSGSTNESTIIGKPVFADPEEKIKAYEEAIEFVKRGETPIDPATGKSFTSKGSRDKDIEYLNERINDLRNYLESINDNDKTPSEIERSGDLLFIRSRIILTVKNSNERYYVNILDEYASGDKKDEDRFLTLEPLEQGISSDKMTKKDLLVKILGKDPGYEFDPLEGSRIKVSGDDSDEYYYVRTYFQPRDIDERDQGDYIRLFNDFSDSNENRIEEMPRFQFEEELLLKKIEIINESNGNKNSVSTTPPPPESSEAASGAPASPEEGVENADLEEKLEPPIKPLLKRKSDGKIFEPIPDPSNSKSKLISEDGETIEIDENELKSGRWDVVIPEKLKDPEGVDLDRDDPTPLKTAEISIDPEKPTEPSVQPPSSSEPVPPPSERSQSEVGPQQTADPINIEGQSGNILAELNGAISRAEGNSMSVSLPVEELKTYLANAAGGGDIKLVDAGQLSYEQSGNAIHIRGLKINAKIGPFSKNVTLSVTLANSGEAEGNIQADLDEIDLGPARGRAEDALKKLNETLMSSLNANLGSQNKGWQTGSIKISGNRVLIGFNKTS